MPTNGDIINALRNMTVTEFRDTIAAARPDPGDYDLGARRQAAAAALQQLVRRGSATVAAALDHDDPAERKAAARRLLHGHSLGDPDAADRRKAEAAARVGDYQRSSLGRGAVWKPQTGNPSDYGQAADSIEAATGLQVGYDGTGANY